MLRKLNRRTKLRKNFKSDHIYQGLLLDKATFQERNIFTSNKVARQFFDDDLFCNILIQRDKFIMNKLNNNQSKKLFPFYPSFIPLIDSKTVVSKEDYYWIANTIEYPCIRCNDITISFLGDFGLKNLLCGNCIEKYYINAKGIFDKRLHDHEFSKYIQDFYIINKEHQKQIFSKLIKREKSLYKNDKSIPQGVKSSHTSKLKNIENVFKSLTK